MHRRALGIVTVATAVGLTAACGGSSGPATAGTASGDDFATDATLTHSISADPGALDPHASALGATAFINGLTYDYLARVDASGKMLPSVATKWEVTPTSTTFTIRDGVTCSDGSKLTPSVIAKSFQYVQDPKNKAPFLGVYLPVGSTTTADDAASTVTLKTTQPYAYLLEGAAQIPLVCAAGLADRTKLQKGAVGSGPFVLTEAVPDDHYTFTARQGYAWGADGAKTSEKGFPAKLVVKVIKNETTAANLLLSGGVQITSLGGADRGRLDKQGGLTRAVATTTLLSLAANQNAGHPGSDPAVRKALMQAVDVDQIGEVALDKRGSKPQGLTIPPSPCLDGSVLDARPKLDVDAAKSQLDAAGWVAGGDGVRAKGGKKLTVTLLYPTSIGGDSIPAGMELLAQQWKAVGVETKLKPVTDTAYAQALFGTGAWDVVILGLGAITPAVIVPFFTGPTAPNGQNFAGVKNDAFAKGAAEAVTTPGDAGCSKWIDAERALIGASDDVPFAGLTTAFYGNKATFTLGGNGAPVPTSYRVLK